MLYIYSVYLTDLSVYYDQTNAAFQLGFASLPEFLTAILYDIRLRPALTKKSNVSFLFSILF